MLPFIIRRRWLTFEGEGGGGGMERVSSPPPCGKPYSSDREEVSYTKFFHTAEELTHEIMVPLDKLPVMIKE